MDCYDRTKQSRPFQSLGLDIPSCTSRRMHTLMWPKSPIDSLNASCQAVKHFYCFTENCPLHQAETGASELAVDQFAGTTNNA